MKQRRSRLKITPTESPAASAKLYEEEAIAGLRAAGYRITMPRVQVIRALATTKEALSAYAIHESIMASDGKIDVVSVYRILGTLQEIGAIYHVGVVDGYFPCRLPNGSTRSEIFVNETSHAVIELQIPGPVVDVLEKQFAEIGLTVYTIKIEAVGTSKR